MELPELRRSHGLHRRSSDGLVTRHVRREAQEAIDTERALGMERAARVEATAFVVHVSFKWLDLLGREEGAQASADPIQASRYAGLVEDFVLVARSQVRKMADGG